jgi:hypothetical protein
VLAGRRPRPLEGHARDLVDAAFEESIRFVLDPAGDVGVGRSAVRRVVLEAAVLGWVMRWRDDDPVGQAVRAAAVVGEDGVRERRRWRKAIRRVDADVHAVGDEDLQRGPERGLRQRMGVTTHEERAADRL